MLNILLTKGALEKLKVEFHEKSQKAETSMKT